ncbi:MAG: histidine kinase dimerization/phosphoacceptor domain -containing protein [Parvibaculum sp.]
MNTSHLPLLLFDGDLRVVGATPSFGTSFGLHADQTSGRTLSELGTGEWNIPQLHILLESALSDESEVGDYETDLRRPGADPRRLILHVQNLVYDDKQNARILLTINDVTDARRTEQMNVSLLLEKDNLLRERAVLLQEMQHRVANSLQIIASVLLLKARTVKSEETRLHLQDAHDRVMSVAAVQQHLQASSGDVEVGPYLVKLCESLASSMIRESRPLALKVHSDEATISSQKAVSLGLIVTELVINALKHAFPDSRGGLVDVSYHAERQDWTLTVTDNGIGRHAASPAAKVGLGTSIVEALANQLGAHIVISDASPGAKIAVISNAAAVQ